MNDTRVTQGKKVRISPATDAKVTRLMKPRESYNVVINRICGEVRELRRENRALRNGKGEA